MRGTDVFWVDDPRHLVDFAAMAGELPHRMGVRHLALSARCFEELERAPPAPARGGYGYDDYGYEPPSPGRQPPRTGWEALKALPEGLQGAGGRWGVQNRQEREAMDRWKREKEPSPEYDESEWEWHTDSGPGMYVGYTADDLVPRHQVSVQAKRMVKLGVLRGRSL